MENEEYSVVIIPPQSVRPAYYVYMDKIKDIEPSCKTPNIPHVTITGFSATSEEIVSYGDRLATKLSIYPSFRLKVGEAVSMSHGRFRRNLSLHVPSSDQFQELCTKIVGETATLTGFARDDLDSYSPHLVLAEAFPTASTDRVVKAANQRWEDLSFDVDRVYIVKRVASEIFIQQVIPLLGFKSEDIPDPNTADAELVLAVMCAMRKPIPSKIRLQKLMFLLGEESLLGHAYSFRPAPLGPYCSQIEGVTKGLASEGLVQIEEITLKGGSKEPIYGLTKLGTEVAGKCYMMFRDKYGVDIAALIRHYGSMPLGQLLQIVHGRWPNLRQRSAVKGEDTA